MDKSLQISTWKADFGRQYTDRNPQTADELDALYLNNFGTTRSLLNEIFLNDLDRKINILEVGCNVGTQLMFLKNMGFNNLFGIEVQRYAVQKAKEKLRGCEFVQGSALELPFRDCAFDLVFTSGVLIHINPEDIHLVIREIYRCTKKYIWGYEYYGEQYEMIQYRKEQNLMWKADFPSLYFEQYPSLDLVKQKKLKYKNGDNVDMMFLISKN